MRELPELLEGLKFKETLPQIQICGDSDVVLEVWAELARIIKNSEVTEGLLMTTEFVTALVWPNDSNERSFDLLVFLHYSIDSNILVRLQDIMGMNLWIVLNAFCSQELSESIINQANIQLSWFLEPHEYGLRMSNNSAVFELN